MMIRASALSRKPTLACTITPATEASRRLIRRRRQKLLCWLRGKCASELEYVLNTISVNEIITGVRYLPGSSRTDYHDLVNLGVAYRPIADIRVIAVFITQRITKLRQAGVFAAFCDCLTKHVPADTAKAATTELPRASQATSAVSTDRESGSTGPDWAANCQ